MFSSILDTPSSTQFDEVMPRTRIPWVGFGFVFAVVFLIAEFAAFIPDTDEQSLYLMFLGIFLAGWCYWLFCVYRFHKILGELSSQRYPITPGEAVGKHFIPVYNLVWLFRWATSFSEYLTERGRVKIISGKLIGLLLLGCFFIRFIDGAVALAGTFGVGMYLADRLRRHIEAVKGITPDMLPPPPDMSLFENAPMEREPIRPETEAPGSMRQL